MRSLFNHGADADEIPGDIKANIVADVQHEMQRLAEQKDNSEWKRGGEAETNAARYCAELLIAVVGWGYREDALKDYDADEGDVA